MAKMVILSGIPHILSYYDAFATYIGIFFFFFVDKYIGILYVWFGQNWLVSEKLCQCDGFSRIQTILGIEKLLHPILYWSYIFI